MKRLVVAAVMLLSVNLVFSQSATTQELHKKYDDAFYLFFYENTLRMINQDNNLEFNNLIKGIEKMKFLRLEKEKDKYNEDLGKLISSYKKEAFEELMSMRQDGSNIKIFIKEKEKVTLGLIMLISDEASLSILDIKGSVPMDQLVSLYDKVKQIN